MLRYLGFEQSAPQKIISDFQNIINSGEQQKAPKLPKFIKTLYLSRENTPIVDKKTHQKAIQCTLQSIMNFVTEKFIQKARDDKKRSSSLLGKVSNSLSKLKFSSGKLTAEKALVIIMIIHCLLQQMRQQISPEIKDPLILFLKLFRKFVQDHLQETNQEKLEKLDQSFKSASNSSRFEFRNKIFTDSSINKTQQLKRNGSKSKLPQQLFNKKQMNKASNQLNTLRKQNNFRQNSHWDMEGSKPELTMYTDQQTELATSRISYNTTKELYLLNNIINPYIVYLHKLIALSQYYHLIKLRNGTNFSMAEVWIPINLLKTLTAVTICFPTIGRYYMNPYGEHVVVLSQLFCMDVLWTYLKIFNLIDTNVKEIEDQMKKITKHELTKNKQQGQYFEIPKKSNSILHQMRKKAAQDQITSFDLEELDSNLKNHIQQEILKNPKLLQNVNQLYKILEQINVINDKLMILFFCKYFRPKISYIKFPKLIENSRRDYPLIYQIHKLQLSQSSTAKNYSDIIELDIKPESLIINADKPKIIQMNKKSNVSDPYKKIRNIMKPKNQGQNSLIRVNHHIPTREQKKNMKFITLQDRKL